MHLVVIVYLNKAYTIAFGPGGYMSVVWKRLIFNEGLWNIRFIRHYRNQTKTWVSSGRFCFQWIHEAHLLFKTRTDLAICLKSLFDQLWVRSFFSFLKIRCFGKIYTSPLQILFLSRQISQSSPLTVWGRGVLLYRILRIGIDHIKYKLNNQGALSIIIQAE